MLDADRIARYSRQLVIPAIGREGQERLGAACVRVLGASGATSPALVYLTLAGVGTLWIDDPEPVAEGDLHHWVFPAGSAGQPRGATAAEALRARSRFVRVFPDPPDEAPTAVLVFATTAAKTLADAEQARKAGLPHVVAEADGDGGSVVTVPVGAPCYSCARSVGAGRKPATSGAAAIASLAAQELILSLAAPVAARGRRIDLTRGVPSMRATARLAGCACGAGIAR